MKRLCQILCMIPILCAVCLCGCQSKPKTAQVTFPAYEDNRTEYNAKIFDVSPFTLSIDLPSGWSIQSPGNQTVPDVGPGFSPVNIMDGDKAVGSIDYNIFELYEDTTPDNFYRSVYNQLMLGSVVNWDNDYTPVKEDGTSCCATCKVYVRNPETNAETYYPAILAYNKDLLVYVNIAFEEGAVDEETLSAIAESVRLAAK